MLPPEVFFRPTDANAVRFFAFFNGTITYVIVYHAVAAAVSYVDDARVISERSPRIYIGELGLVKNIPHQVLIENKYYSRTEPWTIVRGIEYDDGYMYLPSSVRANFRLRIIGTKYLDFLASGVSSTAWTATVNLDSPQTEILIAQAIIYLYRTKIMPTQNVGDSQQAIQALQYWENELTNRKMRYGMTPIPATVNYSR